MGTIHYTKTSFVDPGIPSESEWFELKKLVDVGVVDIDPEPPSFSGHFKGLFQTMVASFVIAVVIFSSVEDGNMLIAVGGLSMMVFIMTIFYLFLEGPSYGGYVRDRKRYFEKLRSAVMNSNNYGEFVLRMQGYLS